MKIYLTRQRDTEYQMVLENKCLCDKETFKEPKCNGNAELLQWLIDKLDIILRVRTVFL